VAFWATPISRNLFALLKRLSIVLIQKGLCMSVTQASIAKVKLSVKERLNLLLPYAKKKVAEQLRAVALIVVYLVAFQTIVLRIPIAQSGIVAVGIAIIVIGLAFFMEGLFLGLMPLGEVIGIRLPQKSKLPGILIFAFILGVGVTFAEPAIGVLQLAGAFIKAWDAPLLFVMLNKHAGLLKNAVGIGVGIAVILGMLRFMYQWSLKWFLFVLVPIVSIFSIWCFFEPNMRLLLSLAWDTGAVTTGPVTVPLVLALGIGISRVVSKGDSEDGGFGVVTLASILPIYTVLIMGLILLPGVPKPMTQAEFFHPRNEQRVSNLFKSNEAMIAYALTNATVDSQVLLTGGTLASHLAYIAELKTDAGLRLKLFGSAESAALERWAIRNGSLEQRLVVFGSNEAIRDAVNKFSQTKEPLVNVPDLSIRNGIAAVQAILPLSVFLVIVLVVLLKERIPRADEVFVGLVFAVLGMFLFNIGIELGLAKLGNQVGGAVPASFKRVELTEQTTQIRNFDEKLVITAITPEGIESRFFYANQNNAYVPIPYNAALFDRETGRYTYIPSKGPIFGSESHPAGFALALLFAFIMGYGATLAEPALNALGTTVEILTVGAFKKSMLIQTVAIGVGVGISVGLVKIIWNVPLLFLIGPPYLLLMFLTILSTDEYVNIGWDSAGVTTGPITVPLVLAIGLGLSMQVGGIEGFGILACASVYPILAVLLVGIFVSRRKARKLKTANENQG